MTLAFGQTEIALSTFLGGVILVAVGVILMFVRRVKNVHVGDGRGPAPSSGEQPPQFSDWREMADWHGERDLNALRELPEEELLARVRNGDYYREFNLWYALREKTTLAKAAPHLLKVLREECGEENMLTRYHCAAALFHLLGKPDEPLPDLRKRVQFDHLGEEARLRAIDELESEIRIATSR